MRFLVDANLPPALARWLAEQGHDATHVSALGLEGARDRDIWRRARDIGACIVSKDGDFVLLNAIDRGGPPVVWIRLGNTVRSALMQRLPALWPDVIMALERGEKIVEVR